MNLPTLYKRTSTGAIQQWTIEARGATIATEYGQVDGKLQSTFDIIKEGKNVGRSNETTPAEQARAEAHAKWEKQLKKGYVKTVEEAQLGKVDDVIEGGVFPMLAKSFSKDGGKIVFPAFVQPKLDGHRCIAVIEDNKASLWSRTRKPITSMPHIIAALEEQARGEDVILDGELYNHGYRDRFEELTSLIRQEEPKPGHEKVQYHIYDMVDAKMPFWDRSSNVSLYDFSEPLMEVETFEVADEEDMLLEFERFLKKGYEGLMVRNSKGLYVNKRSADLQKVKEFMDAEFVVTGVLEGRGKMAGKAVFEVHVGKDHEDEPQKVKMKGALDELRQYVDDPSLAIGRKLTVQFQGYTEDGKLRFPVGLRFREDV